MAHQAPLSMDSPGENTGVGCHSPLQVIFLIQGSNSCLLHWQADSVPLCYLGSPFPVLYYWTFDGFFKYLFKNVEFRSVAQSCPTLCNPTDCSTPGFPVHHQLQELTQTHVDPAGDAIQPSHLLSSPSPPAFNLSQHQGLSIESVHLIRWPKYWSFSFSISLSNEYSGLISLSIDWLDLLAVQETLMFNTYKL